MILNKIATTYFQQDLFREREEALDVKNIFWIKTWIKRQDVACDMDYCTLSFLSFFWQV